MKVEKIPAVEGGIVNVIIETPRASQNKYNYDLELQIFLLKKTLPLGMVFPFDFGFIPNTKGGDGDPLDVLVIMDQPGYPGCLVKCRLLGILEAEQVEKNKKRERNDRIIAVSEGSMQYAGVNDIGNLNKDMPYQVEQFFVNYNKLEGKEFIPKKWGGAHAALKMIKKHTV
jgi:inorganic pyrophosphatase